MKKHIGFWIIPILAMTSASCTQTTIERNEVVREKAPGGKVEAIYYTLDAGATAATAHHVAVVPVGAIPSESDDVLIADRLAAGSPSLKWESDHELRVEFPKARMFKEVMSTKVDGQTIKILR